MKTLEGKLVAEAGKDIRVGIVIARFNEFITSKLLGGALDALRSQMGRADGRYSIYGIELSS